MKTKVFTIAAPRGGAAKTTTAHTLATIAAEEGRRVLLIDLDPQSSLTLWAGGDPTAPGMFEVLTGAADLAEVIASTEQGPDLAAGSANLLAITTKNASIKRLASALDPIRKKYDLIFIDTPPALGELVNNALYAADGLIIPTTTDADGLQALYTITELNRQIKDKPARAACLVTSYDKRPNINRVYLEAIEQTAQKERAPILGTIRRGVAAREARALGKPLTTYAPHSNPANDYKEAYNELKKLYNL